MILKPHKIKFKSLKLIIHSTQSFRLCIFYHYLSTYAQKFVKKVECHFNDSDKYFGWTIVQ